MDVQYEKAGVSIEKGEKLVDFIKQLNPDIGGFAGLYKLNEQQSLVACTDGVGTKLECSILADRLEDIGQDLVAMSVNDLIVVGATPLFFLDYYATGKLDVTAASRVVKGISNACAQAGCVLLGGETAEMPGFYEPPKFDLAGFAVGIVDNKKIVDGSKICSGDVLIGLPSSGFHSNGYSLIRKIMKDNNLTLGSNFNGQNIADIVCTPTHIYTQKVKNVLNVCDVLGMSHITGGGLTNIERVLPENLKTDIDKSKIPTPDYFFDFMKMGNVSVDEAYKVWNMGLGYVFIVKETDVDKVMNVCPEAFVFGNIVPR